MRATPQPVPAAGGELRAPDASVSPACPELLVGAVEGQSSPGSDLALPLPPWAQFSAQDGMT